ncbi:MAG: hypothetical protein Tsb0014_31230 [Pleurocapsa sp.]
MKDSNREKVILLSLLRNSIVQFIAGTISLIIILQLANIIGYKYLEIIFKSFGYGFYYYLATPFVIYWLAYVSSSKQTNLKLWVTVILTALYSYVLWDSYFFFKSSLSFLISRITSPIFY